MFVFPEYSRGTIDTDPALLETQTLATVFTSTERDEVSDANGVTVDQTGGGEFYISIFLFKVKGEDNTANIHVSWLGQSTVDCVTAPIFLEIYNYNTSSWDELANDSTTAADTNTFIEGQTPVGLANVDDYYTSATDVTIAVRVLQGTETDTLKTDEIYIISDPSAGANNLTGYDIIRQIPGTTSDCEERDDSTLVTAITSFRMGLFSTTRYDAGLRFTNITIPSGSVIDSAVLNLYLTTRPSVDQNFIIKGILETNPAVWTSSTRPSQRTKTTTSVNQVISSGLNGYFLSEDITSIVQEIINQGGWVSGNAIAFVIEENSTTSYARARDYSSAQLTTISELGINYSEVTTSTTTSISTSSTTTSSSTSTTTTRSTSTTISTSTSSTTTSSSTTLTTSSSTSTTISTSTTVSTSTSSTT